MLENDYRWLGFVDTETESRFRWIKENVPPKSPVIQVISSLQRTLSFSRVHEGRVESNRRAFSYANYEILLQIKYALVRV